jgi:hypothetical protein
MKRRPMPRCGAEVLSSPAVHEWGVGCVREGEGDPLDGLQVSRPRVGCKGDTDGLAMWHVVCDGTCSAVLASAKSMEGWMQWLLVPEGTWGC